MLLLQCTSDLQLYPIWRGRRSHVSSLPNSYCRRCGGLLNQFVQEAAAQLPHGTFRVKAASSMVQLVLDVDERVRTRYENPTPGNRRNPCLLRYRSKPLDGDPSSCLSPLYPALAVMVFGPIAGTDKLKRLQIAMATVNQSPIVTLDQIAAAILSSLRPTLA